MKLYDDLLRKLHIILKLIVVLDFIYINYLLVCLLKTVNSNFLLKFPIQISYSNFSFFIFKNCFKFYDNYF